MNYSLKAKLTKSKKVPAPNLPTRPVIPLSNPNHPKKPKRNLFILIKLIFLKGTSPLLINLYLPAPMNKAKKRF